MCKLPHKAIFNIISVNPHNSSKIMMLSPFHRLEKVRVGSGRLSHMPHWRDVWKAEVATSQHGART